MTVEIMAFRTEGEDEFFTIGEKAEKISFCNDVYSAFFVPIEVEEKIYVNDAEYTFNGVFHVDTAYSVEPKQDIVRIYLQYTAGPACNNVFVEKEVKI